MQIEILGVNVANKGKYRVAEVSYKYNGKTEGKNVMSFTFKDVFKALSEAKSGDLFDVIRVKNDKGFWDWVEVAATGKNVEAPATGKAISSAVRSSYETSEERAKRQVYIVRQSSVSNAIELAKANGQHPLTEEDIIKSARKIEAYVFDTGVVVEDAEVN